MRFLDRFRTPAPTAVLSNAFNDGKRAAMQERLLRKLEALAEDELATKQAFEGFARDLALQKSQSEERLQMLTELRRAEAWCRRPEGVCRAAAESYIANTPALKEAGATVCDTLKAIAEQAEVIIVMVPDTPDVADALFGAAGVATICRSYRVSIIAPATTLAMYDLVAKGAAMAIGALPALGDGDEPRALTQQWARAIYEDHPAGREITGIHYRSAYNSGESLALWDCDANIEIVNDDAGHPQDIALNDPRILLRLQAELRWRQINVTTVRSSDCNECKKAALQP